MKYIFDGAFGTYYASRTGKAPETAALFDPDGVAAVHGEYLAAGATAISTDTFGVDYVSFPENAGEIIAAAYRIAVRTVNEQGGGAVVFADIGQSRMPSDETYIAVADTFLSLGADRFLFETLTTLSGVPAAVAHIRSMKPDAEIIVSFAIGQDGYTAHGEFYLTLIADAFRAGADIAGLNCVCGPSHMLELLRSVDCRNHSVIAVPNAGYPSLSGGRTVYNDAPEYFASKLYAMCALGISAAGGCCGTTPAHIAAFTAMLAEKQPEIVYAEVKTAPEINTDSGFFGTNRRIIAVELDAPVDTDTSFIDYAAPLMKAAGADYVTVPDSPLARVRADSVMTAARIKRLYDVDVLPHLTCRDRNQIALKGQLIVAWIEGVRSVLVITGDSAARSGAVGVKDVFGFDSVKFIAFIGSLNSDIFAASPLNICAALNVTVPNFDAELRRAELKVNAGATTFLTQPLFSEQHFKNLKRARDTLDAKILAGVMPVAGYRNALFLSGEVSGIDIPDSLIDALKDKDADEVRRISVGFSCEIADRAACDCDGYYLMTPRRKAEFVTDLIGHIRKSGTSI